MQVHKNVATVTAGKAVADFIQDNTSGSCEVVRLQQDDVSEGCIDFVASNRGAVATSTGNSATSVRIELNGTKYVIPLFTDQ